MFVRCFFVSFLACLLCLFLIRFVAVSLLNSSISFECCCFASVSISLCCFRLCVAGVAYLSFRVSFRVCFVFVSVACLCLRRCCFFRVPLVVSVLFVSGLIMFRYCSLVHFSFASFLFLDSFRFVSLFASQLFLFVSCSFRV